MTHLQKRCGRKTELNPMTKCYGFCLIRIPANSLARIFFFFFLYRLGLHDSKISSTFNSKLCFSDLANFAYEMLNLNLTALDK